jgi:hypothetical protein
MPTARIYTLHKRNHTTFHNLCVTKTPPNGIDLLLWNGLKFCLEQPLPKPRLEQTFERLENDIRRQHFWRDHASPDGSDYEKKLYTKSDWLPATASPLLEKALQQFRTKICSITVKNLQQQ